MCGACDRERRVCPEGHVQPKQHGDVFAEPVLCVTCGQETEIVDWTEVK